MSAWICRDARTARPPALHTRPPARPTRPPTTTHPTNPSAARANERFKAAGAPDAVLARDEGEGDPGQQTQWDGEGVGEWLRGREEGAKCERCRWGPQQPPNHPAPRREPTTQTTP